MNLNKYELAILRYSDNDVELTRRLYKFFVIEAARNALDDVFLDDDGLDFNYACEHGIIFW